MIQVGNLRAHGIHLPHQLCGTRRAELAARGSRSSGHVCLRMMTMLSK